MKPVGDIIDKFEFVDVILPALNVAEAEVPNDEELLLRNVIAKKQFKMSPREHWKKQCIVSIRDPIILHGAPAVHFATLPEPFAEDARNCYYRCRLL